MRVLCIGECMAELSPLAMIGDYRLGFAGDTFNTAWYLAQLAPEATVSYFTALGEDTLSADLRRFIEENGIDARHVQTVPGGTLGLYLISLKEGERGFTYWRENSAARRLADAPAALAAAMKDCDLVYFSGITMAILSDKGRHTLLDALATARRAGKTVAFDPNLRPLLWIDREQMCSEIMRGAAVADIALPSFEDEADWFGDADPAATSARYLDAGAARVIVKNGAGPVHYRDGDAEGEVAVVAASPAIDTTAAGDSFNAGILAGQATGHALEDAIEHACRLARMVVCAKGALVPIELDFLHP